MRRFFIFMSAILFVFSTQIGFAASNISANPWSQYSLTQTVHEGELCGDVDQNALRGGVYYECARGLSCDFFEQNSGHVFQDYGRCVADERFMCESTGGVVYDDMSCNCPLDENGGCDQDLIRVTHESQYDVHRDELNIEITARNTSNQAVTWSEYTSGCSATNEDVFGVRIRYATPPYVHSPTPNPRELYLVGNGYEFYEFSDTDEYYDPTYRGAGCSAMVKNSFHFYPREEKRTHITIPGSYLSTIAYIVETKYGGSFQYTSDDAPAYSISCSGDQEMVNGVCQDPEPIITLTSYFLRDIANHWGEHYIQDLLAHGIVQGYQNRMFYPDRSITRAEFTKMLLLALSYDIVLQPATFQTFDDVRVGDWYSDYVYTGSTRGLIQGYPDDTFRPDDAITRAEAVALAMRAHGVERYHYSHSFFYDVHKDWQKPYIETAYRLNLINGKGGGRFDPEGFLTRAEASKIVSNIIARMDSNAPELKPLILETTQPWRR